MSGGGQERGLRSGTLAAPLIVGFGEACRICLSEHEFDYKKIKRLATRLINGIKAELDDVIHNGDDILWYPGNIFFILLLKLLKTTFNRLRKSFICIC